MTHGEDKAALGPRLARRRSQDFESKIHAWNAGDAPKQPPAHEEPGEGEVRTERVKPERAKAENVRLENQKTQRAPSPTKARNAPVKVTDQYEIDLQRQAWIRRRERVGADLGAELRQAIAPKKRVVSDAHWRRDREANEAAAAAAAAATVKSPPSSPRPDYEDSGVKVYIKRRQRSHTTEPPDSKPAAEKPKAASAGVPSPEKPSSWTAAEKKEPPRPKNRIEGWLETTEDPFTERDALTPKPLNLSRHTRSEGSRVSVASETPTKVSTPSTAFSTSSLRRSGARRQTQSPVKERPPSVVTSPVKERPASISTDNVSVTDVPSRRPPQLSTIASAETLSSPPAETIGVVGLKRRLTKHSDLMSVLSSSKPSSRVKSVRRRDVAGASTADIMNEVSTDELKYQRELRTLVDGVIPVLLTHVLQKADATGTKRLFSGTAAGRDITRPIVEMGVALEKLKASHKRIPLHDANELVRWAENTSRHYAEYLKVWRLGFQDIVVNLAPADGSDKSAEAPEKADVAHLLRRPLVRLKYLARALKGIDEAQPSEKARATSLKYADLLQTARQRNDDERARLEDEAASSIDPTRARDPRSLAPLAGVAVDPTRSVRARDYFDMDLTHSTGQQLLCKVELILRDDMPGRGGHGDILFCELSLLGRWLLFPPIPANYVSARRGDRVGEIVVMVRGMLVGGKEWHEVMSLTSDDDAAVGDWLDMLSASPTPPRLPRVNTFVEKHTPAPQPPSPTEVDVPIGEKATSSAQRWDGTEVNSVSPSKVRPGSEVGSAKTKSEVIKSSEASSVTASSITGSSVTGSSVTASSTRSSELSSSTLKSRSETSSVSASTIRPQRKYQSTPTSPIHEESAHGGASSSYFSKSTGNYSVWMPPTEDGSDYSDSELSHNPPYRNSAPATPRHAKPPPFPTSAPPMQKKAEPATPVRNRPVSMGLKSGILPSLTPAFLKRNRRPSSPLKHEYEPSAASVSHSSSSLSDSSEEDTLTSDSSDSEDEVAISTIGSLKDFRKPYQHKPRSVPSLPGETVGPSESASQAPYRQVPPLSPTARLSKSVSSIFGWSDRGSWDSLHPGECNIIVTPGLIEAFDTAQSSSFLTQNISPSQRGIKPLIALELTPLVPLRRGTALDISIRSPPTQNSLLRANSNIMFRSRTSEECTALYNLINRARIDNPTYIALQNARPRPTSTWGAAMDQRNAERKDVPSVESAGSGSGISWLRRRGTYRSKGGRIHTPADSTSQGTSSSAMSALRRFGAGGKLFNIAKSTLSSRGAESSLASEHTTQSGEGRGGASFGVGRAGNASPGSAISSSSIRFYIRESASKWRDLGRAKLTILLPQGTSPSGPKRVLIIANAGHVLLDVTLPENCYERVARTGIAVSVWQDCIGPDGEVAVMPTGGVGIAREKVFLVRMRNEREAAYTFSLVGKLRY
ncbi:hypothetical protein K470DRAFT_215196 [Piedraia hortae CBS 480.64]|uniref:DH domain-containing protein n=1 Tax=Piedraia hortae CBS 480.64 TaxID=1314780 RepID=A0A6A7C1H1_9PEZI|nr:hypothetical protein K470DRAFT_215196 [Piedraia hortae CBS 480.64]